MIGFSANSVFGRISGSVMRKSALLFLFACVLIPSVFSANHRVTEEEFKRSLELRNFTTSYRMQLSMDGQTLVNVNGFSENEDDEAFYSFNVVLDNLVAMALNSYFGNRVDGRYSVRAKNIRNLRDAKTAEAVEKALGEADIAVKAPGMDSYTPVSGFIGSMMDNFKIKASENPAGFEHDREELLDFKSFVYENGRYTRRIASSDSDIVGRLSLSFSDGWITSLLFEGDVVPDMGDAPFADVKLNTKVQIRYSKINATKITD